MVNHATKQVRRAAVAATFQISETPTANLVRELVDLRQRDPREERISSIALARRYRAAGYVALSRAMVAA